MHKRMIIALCSMSLLLTGFAAADGHEGGGNGGQGGQNRVTANLTGAAIGGEKPNGSAKSVTNNGQSRFTAEVEDVNLPDATVLSVTLIHEGNRMLAGTMVLSQGAAE